MRSRKIKCTFRILRKGRVVQRYDSSSIQRFRNHTRPIRWQNRDFKVYLKVNYGNRFHNDGIYENQKDFFFALDAFVNPAIPNYLYE